MTQLVDDDLSVFTRSLGHINRHDVIVYRLECRYMCTAAYASEKNADICVCRTCRHMHVCRHAYMCTVMHAEANKRACTHAIFIKPKCLCTCLCTCLHRCLCTCCVCTLAYAHVYIHACAYAYAHVYVHAYPLVYKYAPHGCQMHPSMHRDVHMHQ